jgi:hypothetical protein
MNEKRPIMLPFVALALLTGCAPDPVKIGTGTSGYYQQAIGLLDPGNPMPPILASAVGNGDTNELCGVKTGMTMAGVVSAWGKPRALGITTIGSATLVYGQFYLRFDDGKLDSISPDSRSKWKIPSATGTAPRVPITIAEAYCQNLNDLFETNSEDRAVQSLVTNAVISIAKLKSGEIGGYRLGMTMSGLVALMGKPRYFCQFSTDRATLYYSPGYGFRGDSLSGFYVSVPRGNDGIRFDNGLSVTNTISGFVKTLGPPLRLVRNFSDYWLTYHFGDTYVSFLFQIAENIKDPDTARESAALSDIALHVWGGSEICAEADERLADVVTGLTGIHRDKMYLVRMTKSVDSAVAKLENVMGNPLTAEQRRNVVVALEEHKRAIKKAYDDEE